MSRLLALDQSTRITGWAIFENGKLIKYGKFDAGAKGGEINDRLVVIRNTIKQLISDYQITEVVIEDIQEQNNITTYKALAEVYGVLEEMLTEEGIPYRTVFASSWKSTCGVKGRARAEQKKNAQAYVENTYAIKATQDESDAICIGTHVIKEKNSAFNWD